jgi:hypothetical protein
MWRRKEEALTMKHTFLLKWVSTNAVGLGVAFVALLQTGMLLEYGFDFERHWRGMPPTYPAPLIFYVKVLVSYVVGGTIFGLAQTWVLRSRSVPVRAWILATSAGYGLTAILLWPLIATEALGNIPGPVEPIMATIGGASVAGVVQYLTIRRRGIVASRWVVLWVLGLFVSLLPTALFFISVEGVGIVPSQFFQVFFSGFLTAGVAAWISGKALLDALKSA